MATAHSTYKVFLMVYNNTVWEKVMDIKSIPDLGSAPEMLDTTTLSDRMETNIPGIIGSTTMEFEANYTAENYDRIESLKGEVRQYAVWVGGDETTIDVVPTGEHGKFYWSGEISGYVTGGGVNEVLGLSVSISTSTVILKGEPS